VNKFETYGPLLNKALFSKYSSSQNYYYSKDINDILDNESTPAVVYFRDLECIVEDEEYLKRFTLKFIIDSMLEKILRVRLRLYWNTTNIIKTFQDYLW